ncbi:MAG: serine protease [Mariniblastus sp.]|nr:serine protease [Mariniblastus sp.]
MRIECPICEFQSDLDSAADLSRPLTCDTCHKTFSFSPELVVQPAKKIPPAAIVKPTVATTPKVGDPPAPSVTDLKWEGQPAAKTTYRRGQKRLKQAVVLGLLGLVALVLIGLITFSGTIRETLAGFSEQRDPAHQGQDRNAPAAETGQLQPPGDATNQVPSPLGSPREVEETGLVKRAADAKDSIARKKEPAIVFSEPKPRIFSAKSIGDTWLKVQPHLVELSAETVFGPIHATGILIDSRGWVLTSYRAIQGAREITVSQSRKSIEDPQGELTDLVRGVIASDPEYDLAILKVNRRFVTEFRDLPIVERDLVVARQHLVQCASPSDAYPWPAVECPVQSRKTYGEFEESEQQQLTEIGYGENGASWIVHRVPSPRNRGAALVNEQGELVGMTVQAFPLKSSTDLCLALPARYILDLKQQASDTSSPLPLPQLDRPAASQLAENDPSEPASEEAAAAEPDDPGGLDVLPQESLWYDLSLELNRAGRTCSQFGWWPGDDDQTADLQFFVDQLATIHRVIAKEQTADENEAAVLQGQIDYWWQQLSAGFQPAGGLSKAARAELNQRFARGIKDQSILNLIALGQVHIPLSADLRDQDTNELLITFQLNGTDQLVTAVADEAWPALRPGTGCLIVAELQPAPMMIQDPETDQGELSFLANIRFLKRFAPEP